MPGTSRHLLLVRHGQSAWNAVGRWQGQADPPLSPLGEQQAADAAAHLAADAAAHPASVGFSMVVSSDLQRARRTAELLAGGLGLDISLEPGLREIDVGAWTGLTRTEIEARWPGELADWSEGRSESPLDGETRTHLTERARSTMSRLAARASPGDRLLLVTHGALIRNLDRALAVAPQHIGNLMGRWYRADGNGSIAAAEVVSLVDPGELTLSPSP